MLGHYRFTAYRSDPGPPPLRAVDIVDPDGGPAVRAEVARGARVAAGTCLARDLANLPGQDLTPEHLVVLDLGVDPIGAVVHREGEILSITTTNSNRQTFSFGRFGGLGFGHAHNGVSHLLSD